MDVKLKVQKTKLWLIVLFFSVVSLISCKEKKLELRPNYVIGKDTMVQMLAEIHLLESSIGIRIFEEKKIIYTRNIVKSKIYKKYGVSKERFFKSYNYYTQNSESIDTIYTDVISEISKRQFELLKK
jgi:hypothetical protein